MHAVRFQSVVLAFILSFGFVHALCAQTARQTYDAISEKSSKVHWCLQAAGSDSAGIIESRCQIYSECLASAKLTAGVDELPFPAISEDLRQSLRKCHQALFNAAIMNPQLKGSKATQDWLQHHVMKGTEAKSFPVPASTATPH